MNIFFYFYHIPPKNFELLEIFWHLSGNFSLYTKMTIFFSFMTQKISGLLKNFRIAMLTCYQCFSVSDIEVVDKIKILGTIIENNLSWNENCMAKQIQNHTERFKNPPIITMQKLLNENTYT